MGLALAVEAGKATLYGGKLGQHRAVRSALSRLGKISPALLVMGSSLGLGFALEKFGDMDEIFRL